jgi:hypothetical protein
MRAVASDRSVEDPAAPTAAAVLATRSILLR